MLFEKYNYSIVSLVQSVYPEHHWKPWKLGKLSLDWWASLGANLAQRDLPTVILIRTYLADVEQQLHIKSPEDWYNVTIELLEPNGVRPHFDALGGLFNVLATAVPSFPWKMSTFLLSTASPLLQFGDSSQGSQPNAGGTLQELRRAIVLGSLPRWASQCLTSLIHELESEAKLTSKDQFYRLQNPLGLSANLARVLTMLATPLHTLVGLVYPNYPFNPLCFYDVPPSVLTVYQRVFEPDAIDLEKQATIRSYFDFLRTLSADQQGLDPELYFYKFAQSNDARIFYELEKLEKLSSDGSGLIYFVERLWPDVQWKGWLLPGTSPEYWTRIGQSIADTHMPDKGNLVAQFVRHIEEKYHIKALEDWYEASQALDPVDSRRFKLLANHPSTVLKSVYREHLWRPWKFENSPGSWWAALAQDLKADEKRRTQIVSLLAEWITYLTNQHSIKELDQWYLVSQQQLGGVVAKQMKFWKSPDEQFQGLPFVLRQVFPSHPWQIPLFHSSWEKSQHSLANKVQELLE